MRPSSFQVGDLIVGNGLAAGYYGITVTGTQWVVIKLSVRTSLVYVVDPQAYQRFKQEGKTVEDMMKYAYDVQPHRFDFVQSLTTNKDNAHLLERYDS